MPFSSIDTLINDLKSGQMIILVDDEDRENEGDILVLASHVTPEHINFMATHCRGLICLTLTEEHCKRLELPLMVKENQEQFLTAFTVSIEAAKGITTGISASDRALTIQTAVAPCAVPSDLVQPGHIFPVMAQPGGVLRRAGHTEAGCDLARLAGYLPAAVICEIMNADGSMARRRDLEKFADLHNIALGTISDLIQYRALNETTVRLDREEMVNTEFGKFKVQVFSDLIRGETHLALIMGKPIANRPCLVRVHIPDTFRDLVQLEWDGRGSWPLAKALKKVSDVGEGVVVILQASLQENLSERLCDYFNGTMPPASHRVVPYLTVGTGSQILKHAGVGKMRLLSAPMRFGALSGFDLEVVEYVEF